MDGKNKSKINERGSELEIVSEKKSYLNENKILHRISFTLCL
jgi:hypothetical protein